MVVVAPVTPVPLVSPPSLLARLMPLNVSVLPIPICLLVHVNSVLLLLLLLLARLLSVTVSVLLDIT